MKKKVLLHNIQYTIGGPKTVLNAIINSYLNDKYEFVFINQSEACGFNPLKAFTFIRKYTKLINAENADVIYICGLQYSGLLMTIASRMSNVKKIVLSVHGSDWDTPNKSLRKWILMHIVEPLQVLLADSVFTVCEAAQQTIGALKAGGGKNNKGVVYNTFPDVCYESISSGVLRKELGIPKDKIIVATVGRVVKEKGHQYIIDAIKQLPNSRFVYVIVGEGPYMEEYKKQCVKEIKDKQLFLLGVRNDVMSILKDADIFLFATLNENHSLALLEAVNMKCAALVTNVGGNPEIIEHGVSGYVVPSRDSMAIVNGLLELQDNFIREKFAEQAYQIAKNKFSVENTYGKLDHLFGI